jgi:hypothetical protein
VFGASFVLLGDGDRLPHSSSFWLVFVFGGTGI